MSQVTYEIIRKLFEIYPIILQIVLFLVLWNVFFRWEKGIWIVAGILGSDEYLYGAMAGKAGVIRYIAMSAVIGVGILFLQIPKHLKSAVFILAAVLQFSCVKLFDCRQYLSMYSGEHI
ncbi:MAG: hypothetical protein ACLTS6_03225 [Anaerobutyricum sp.]